MHMQVCVSITDITAYRPSALRNVCDSLPMMLPCGPCFVSCFWRITMRLAFFAFVLLFVWHGRMNGFKRMSVDGNKCRYSSSTVFPS